MRSTIAVGVLVCLFATPASSGQAFPFGSELASRPVASFDVRELNLIDALVQLGQEQRVPIGIEYIDAAAFHSRITLRVRNSTIGGLLDTITHGQGYSWFTQGEVSTVSCRSAGMAHGSCSNRRGIWIKTRHTDYGESSNMTGTTVRNTAGCFRSGDWVSMTLNNGQASSVQGIG